MYIIIIRGHPSVTYAGVAGGAGMAIFCATFLVIVVCAIVKRRRASKVKSEWDASSLALVEFYAK